MLANTVEGHTRVHKGAHIHYNGTLECTPTHTQKVHPEPSKVDSDPAIFKGHTSQDIISSSFVPRDLCLFTQHTYTHTGKHCRLKLMYPHIHAHCGGNVPTLQICVVTFKVVKSEMLFFLLRHHEGVRLVNLRSIFSTGFIMSNIKDHEFIMHEVERFRDTQLTL